MYIKARCDFFDKKNHMQLRKREEILEVDEQRGRQLMALRLAEETDEPARNSKKQTAG